MCRPGKRKTCTWRAEQHSQFEFMMMTYWANVSCKSLCSLISLSFSKAGSCLFKWNLDPEADHKQNVYQKNMCGHYNIIQKCLFVEWMWEQAFVFKIHLTPTKSHSLKSNNRLRTYRHTWHYTLHPSGSSLHRHYWDSWLHSLHRDGRGVLCEWMRMYRG